MLALREGEHGGSGLEVLVDLERVPVEWTVVYPVNPNDPIGQIRREAGGFRAWLLEEDLGVHGHPDRAVEAVWERYLERARMDHDVASRTHGSDERH